MTQGEDEAAYKTLTNLCYQLRHENEELISALSQKTALVETCEREINLLKEKLKAQDDKRASESEQALAERMHLSDDRLRLMQENTRLDERVREYEMKFNSASAELNATKEQIEILLTQLGTPAVTPGGSPRRRSSVDLSVLEKENERLKNELETMKFIHDVHQQKEHSPKRRRTDSVHAHNAANELPAFVISGEDTLLRIFESIVGYNAVQTGDVVTLISNINKDTFLRFRVPSGGDEISLLPSDGIDESALALLESTSSTAAVVAKQTLIDLTKSLFSNN